MNKKPSKFHNLLEPVFFWSNANYCYQFFERRKIQRPAHLQIHFFFLNLEHSNRYSTQILKTLLFYLNLRHGGSFLPFD
jgi:hypothetical protein